MSTAAARKIDLEFFYELPKSCLIINPTKTHFVDIIVGLNTTEMVGGPYSRESVVMIRNVTKISEVGC
jgi:hypothetical protein